MITFGKTKMKKINTFWRELVKVIESIIIGKNTYPTPQ